MKELELTVESRSFVNRVNDQVRKRQERSSMNVTEDWERQDLWIGDKWLGKSFMSLIGDERIINLQRTKVYVFSDSVLCLGKIQENSQSNDAWEQRLGWLKSSPEFWNFDRIDGEPMDFEWNICPGFNTLQLNDEVKCLLMRLGKTPENFTGRIIFMTMFSGISCGSRANEKECLANARLVTLYARRFGKGQWSFIGLGSEKKWYSISEDSPQGEWDRTAEKMLVELAESGCPIFRATSPLSRGRLKSKGHGKFVDTLCSRFGNDWDYFSHYLQTSSVFTEQSRRCVKSMNPFTRDRGNPLSEGNQVLHTWWAWSRQKRLWIVVIVLTKIFYCNNMENELKSYHNKTN